MLYLSKVTWALCLVILFLKFLRYSMSTNVIIFCKQTESNNLFKLLIESLMLSHVLYSLPVWDPSFSDANVTYLKVDSIESSLVYGSSQVWPYISSFSHSNHWGAWYNIAHFVQCISSIFNLYIRTQMVPLLLFGHQHQYATHTTRLFAQPPRFRLLFSQI